MRRRAFLISAFAIASVRGTAAAQEPSRVFRIGWITAQRAASLTDNIAAFRKGLADFGYFEGRNLIVEFRYGDDAVERVSDLAAELMRLPVDLIVAQGAAVSVLSKLNLRVPIVYVFSGDPVTAGLAESLARPLGNMTGLTFMAAELNGKRLELLNEIVPQLRSVAVIANPAHPGEHVERGYFEGAARDLGLSIAYFPTRTNDELVAAFESITASPPQGISVFADGFAVQNRQSILDFAMRLGVPVISGWSVFARSGAICTYGPRLVESYARLAYYVDRVLKGDRPVDIPIEQPTHFELVVNLRAAKTLGLSIPPSVLVRADEVIE
jgi:putative ABC transport system substrate-binding protein